MRQIYKTHLKNQTMGAEKDILRIFNGVANDAQQKGELFGLHNLLKYKVELLVDMATLANLDCDKFEDELAGFGKGES